MDNDVKFWLCFYSLCCAAILIVVLGAVAGCREVEKTNQTAIQNGYQMDRGEWRKH